jgi:hypothetical protein
MPSQLFGVGGSVQFNKRGGLFHEISLTRLTVGKSSIITTYEYEDDKRVPFGYEQKHATAGLRYEVGKYFGKRKDAKFRFGLSGSIEPTYHSFKRTPYSFQEYRIKAQILTIDVAVIPTFSFAISKKVSLDFKFLPNILMADYGKITEKNPTLPTALQSGKRDYTSPEMSYGFSAVLRYTVKEEKKKRGED